MLTGLTALVAIFFLGMGVLALAAPERISAINGQPTLTAAGRNEVRAVYGGFGVAIALLLAVAPSVQSIAPGALLAVAIALGGMAAGRLVAAVIERPSSFYPSWFYFTVEAAMAAMLLAASDPGAWL